MDTTRLARFAPLTGFVFVALAVASLITMGSSPDFADKPAAFAEYYNEESSRVIFGSMLMIMAGFFLIWFLGSLGAASRTAEGGDGRVSRLAFGGGLVGSALFLAGMSASMMAGLRADDQGSISEDVAVVYGDLSVAMGFIGGPVAFAVLLAGTALVNSRTPFLPRWLTWVSGLVALGLFAPVVSWAFLFFAFPVWVLLVAGLLYARGPGVTSAS